MLRNIYLDNHVFLMTGQLADASSRLGGNRELLVRTVISRVDLLIKRKLIPVLVLVMSSFLLLLKVRWRRLIDFPNLY